MCGSRLKLAWFIGFCRDRVLAGPDRIEQKPIDDPCLPVGLKQIVYVDNEPNELIGTGMHYAVLMESHSCYLCRND